MRNIAVFVSGGGTNLQALIDAEKAGKIENGKLALVVASKPDCYALTRAEQAGIPTVIIERKSYTNEVEFCKPIISVLKENMIDFIVLAGFMSIFSKELTDLYPYRIINVHPALIPSFCGKGFYGLRVHRAALDAGVKITGATVHFVNEEVDAGPILLQKAVEVLSDDTPETLQKRVMEQAEWHLLPKALSLLCSDKIEIKDGKAYTRI